jgi:hypothetical protein
MADNYPPLPAGFEVVEEPSPQQSASPPMAAAPAGSAPVDDAAMVPPLPAGFELLPDDYGSGSIDVDITGGRRQNSQTAAAPNASLFRADSDFRERSGAGAGQMLWAAAKDMFGSREGAAKYLAENVGGSIGRDAKGQPVLTLKDGTSYLLNDEGFDSTDAANIAGNVAAFASPAGWVGRAAQARNVGLGGRMALQAATAGATDAGLQAATSEGSIDPARVLASTAGGAGGELVGSGIGLGINRLAALSRTGTGRNAATNALAQAGAPVTEASINRLAPLMGQLSNGANQNALLGQSEYGLQYTLGQRLTDPAAQFRQLSREEVLRQTPGGGGMFRQLDESNTNAVGNALTEITGRLGGRAAQSPAEMAGGSAMGLRQQAERLRSGVDDAYGAVRDAPTTSIAPGAVAEIPQRMRQAVRDYDINPATTPATSRALDQMAAATNAITASPEGAAVRGITLRALESQRRILGNAVNTAANPTDRAAMTALRREFDGWMDEAIDSSLATGDRQALDLLRTARGLRAEYGRRFEGGADSDRFIAGLLDGSRSPEELVNIALGAGQVSKSGAARFIERLRVASANDPDVIGGLRGAHFTRMTRGNDGNPLGAGQILRNIRSTDYNNASVVRALYEPGQWAEVRRFASALEPLVARGDFARSSGSGERIVRAFMDQFVPRIPFVGDMVRGARGAMDSVRAGQAINAPVAARPMPLPAFPAVGAATLDEQVR